MEGLVKVEIELGVVMGQGPSGHFTDQLDPLIFYLKIIKD